MGEFFFGQAVQVGDDRIQFRPQFQPICPDNDNRWQPSASTIATGTNAFSETHSLSARRGSRPARS